MNKLAKSRWFYILAGIYVWVLSSYELGDYPITWLALFTLHICTFGFLQISICELWESMVKVWDAICELGDSINKIWKSIMAQNKFIEDLYERVEELERKLSDERDD